MTAIGVNVRPKRITRTAKTTINATTSATISPQISEEQVVSSTTHNLLITTDLNNSARQQCSSDQSSRNNARKTNNDLKKALQLKAESNKGLHKTIFLTLCQFFDYFLSFSNQ